MINEKLSILEFAKLSPSCIRQCVCVAPDNGVHCSDNDPADEEEEHQADLALTLLVDNEDADDNGQQQE